MKMESLRKIENSLFIQGLRSNTCHDKGSKQFSYLVDPIYSYYLAFHQLYLALAVSFQLDNHHGSWLRLNVH